MSTEALLEYRFLHNKLQLAKSKNLITRVLKNRL